MSELSIIDGKIERVLDTQGDIFKEIKALRQDYADQKVMCENRFTTIETKDKVNSKWKSGFGKLLYVIFGGSFTLIGKWLMDKFS